MSSCVVCKNLCRRNLPQNGEVYQGSLQALITASDLTPPSCLSCKLLIQGILKFEDIRELRILLTDDRFANNLRIFLSPGTAHLRVYFRIYKIPVPLIERNSWFWEERYARTTVERTLEFYIEPGCKVTWDVIQLSRHLDTNTTTIAAEKLPKWLEHCSEKHKTCSRMMGPTLPSRVLDLGDSGSPLRPILYETGGDKGDYICLSHCWGTHRPLITNKDNLSQFLKEIPWNLLPLTFQNAAELTRSLGIRYLWIDSLCIVQNDREDWEREAPKMADIYGNSFLTLSATAASNSSEGLFPANDSTRPVPYGINITDIYGEEVNVFVRQVVDHEAFTTLGAFLGEQNSLPLMRRAWCFQEHILSSRVIQFSKHDIVWECNEMLECSCGDTQDTGSQKAIFTQFRNAWDDENYDEDIMKELYHRCWVQCVVSPYTARLLTEQTDRIVALSGVAQVIESCYNDQYLAGLWRTDVVNGLCWYRQRTDEPPSRRPAEYLAPTWSWASVNSHVRWSHWYIKSSESDIEIIDAKCTQSMNSSTGAVQDGSLNISGPLIQGQYSYRDIRGKKRYFVNINSIEQSFVPDVKLESLEEVTGAGGKIFLLRICHTMTLKHGIPEKLFPNTRALVLIRGFNCFQRIGYLETYDEEVLHWFKDSRSHTVLIS